MQRYKEGNQPQERAGALAREAKQFASSVVADLRRSGATAKSNLLETARHAANGVKQTAQEVAKRPCREVSKQLAQCGAALINAAEALREDRKGMSMIRKAGRMCSRHPVLLFCAAFLTGAATRHCFRLESPTK